jgi:NCS1 family nucleobase:cation symporter-1
MAKRELTDIDCFLLWAGAAISLAEVLAGGLLAPLGFAAAMLAIVCGHLLGGIPMALGHLIGAKEKITAMYSVRPAFGVRGSYIASVLNVLQLIGWTAVMLIIGAGAANAISSAFGFDSFYAWVIFLGLVTTLWSVFVGEERWRLVQKVSVSLLLVLTVVMTYLVFTQYGDLVLNFEGTGEALSFAIALDLVIAMPVSWLPLVADYGRFAKNPKKSSVATYAGYFLLSSWMYFVGYVAAVSTGNSDMIPIMLALNLGILAMLITLFSTFTTTFMDIYSAAMSSLNVGDIGERRAIVLFGVVGTLVALVFPMEQYEWFLLMIGSVFVPLFGIVFVHYFLIGKPEKRNFGWCAIACWLIGILVYHAILYSSLEIGSSLPSLVVAGGLYLGLKKKAQ